MGVAYHLIHRNTVCLSAHHSDCDADGDVIGSHHYLNHTEQQGVADILHAGTDVDCGGNIGQYAQSALDAGTITEADIDERLAMLFRVRMRLGHFDPLGPLQAIGADQICSEYAIATSMEVRKRVFLRNLNMKMTILPRQARDKHIGKTQKRDAFSRRGRSSRRRSSRTRTRPCPWRARPRGRLP